MNILYTAVATVKGGREGHVRTEDGVLDMDLRAPKEMGGESGYANPEALFAAGFAACFNSALMLAARRKKLNADDAEITLAVSIFPDAPSYKLSVRIDGKFHGMSKADANILMKDAHQLCPYSKATRGNIDVKLYATVE